MLRVIRSLCVLLLLCNPLHLLASNDVSTRELVSTLHMTNLDEGDDYSNVNILNFDNIVSPSFDEIFINFLNDVNLLRYCFVMDKMKLISLEISLDSITFLQHPENSKHVSFV